MNDREGDNRLVLVTGAAGCVGRLLVDILVEQGYRVRATDRTVPTARERRREGDSPSGASKVEWLAADLTEAAGIERLFEGAVWAVIHTAAWVDISVPFGVQAPINLHAVEALHTQARNRGVERFIHFSTGSLYAPKSAPLVESDPLMPSSGYELAKLLAEDFLLRQQAPPLVTILRPALIYGPRGKVLVASLATLPPLIESLSGLIPHLQGGPMNNMVHARDVARAALHLLEHPQPHGSIFNVASPDAKSLGDYMDIVMAEGGVRLAPIELPFPSKALEAALPLLTYDRPFRWINKAASALWRKRILRHSLRPELVPRMDPEAVPYLLGDTVFDPGALLATGFTFQFGDFESGWADTLSWYRNHGWLPWPQSSPGVGPGSEDVRKGAAS